MIVFGPQYGPKIAAAAPARFHPAHDTAMARIVDGEIAGGFLFCDYTGPGGSMLTHVAGFRPGWLTRGLLFNAANYCFNHARCSHIYGQVRASKPDVLKFDLKLGWKEVAVLPGVYPDGACHVLAMTPEDCRWLAMGPKGKG